MFHKKILLALDSFRMLQIHCLFSKQTFDSAVLCCSSKSILAPSFLAAVFWVIPSFLNSAIHAMMHKRNLLVVNYGKHQSFFSSPPPMWEILDSNYNLHFDQIRSVYLLSLKASMIH